MGNPATARRSIDDCIARGAAADRGFQWRNVMGHLDFSPEIQADACLSAVTVELLAPSPTFRLSPETAISDGSLAYLKSASSAHSTCIRCHRTSSGNPVNNILLS